MKTTTPQTAYPKIYKSIVKMLKNRREQLKKGIEEQGTIEGLKSHAYYRDHLTPAKWGKITDFKGAKEQILKSFDKETAKRLIQEQTNLNEIFNAPDLTSIEVTIEWKKNRTWGANPTANAIIKTKARFYTFNSGSIGGCGYDKESTAFAKAVNQSLSLSKLLCDLKEKKGTNKANRDFFGYGSGHGEIPRFAGGVGVSCYYSIFEKLGFKMVQVGNGKMFNVYHITKK